MLDPGAPVIGGFPEKVLDRMLQRGLKRLPVGEGQVSGSTQHQGLVSEKMADRYIGGQPHLLNTVIKVDVITAPEFIERCCTVGAYGLTYNTYTGSPSQWFDFPNQHQRLEVTLILPETRGKVSNPIRALRRCYFCTKYIGILDIILLACKFTYGLYR